MSLAWTATLTCDRCGQRLLVEYDQRAPVDGTAVRDAGQNAGWVTRRNHRGTDLCPVCATETAA